MVNPRDGTLVGYAFSKRYKKVSPHRKSHNLLYNLLKEKNKPPQEMVNKRGVPFGPTWLTRTLGVAWTFYSPFHLSSSPAWVVRKWELYQNIDLRIRQRIVPSTSRRSRLYAGSRRCLSQVSKHWAVRAGCERPNWKSIYRGLCLQTCPIPMRNHWHVFSNKFEKD